MEELQEDVIQLSKYQHIYDHCKGCDCGDTIYAHRFGRHRNLELRIETDDDLKELIRIYAFRNHQLVYETCDVYYPVELYDRLDEIWNK